MHRFQKWREAIQLAPDTQAIASLIADYVKTIGPEQMAGMPLRCQLVLQDAPADIQGAAVTLLQEELAFSGDPATAAILHEVAHTFAAASTRVSQIHGRLEPTVPRK